jgi:hypothetical protein
MLIAAASPGPPVPRPAAGPSRTHAHSRGALTPARWACENDGTKPTVHPQGPIPLPATDRYFDHHVRYQPLDHVNLSFEDRAVPDARILLADIVQVLDQCGWTRGWQNHLYLRIAKTRLEFETDWRTRGPLWDRYHVRLWCNADHVIGLAHQEHLALWPLTHDVDSFDAGRDRVVSDLTAAGWRLAGVTGQLSTPIVDPAADGCVVRLLR